MIIDLSYPMHEGMLKYPSDPEVKIETTTANIISGENPIYKSGYALLTIRNHHGTHIDAPAHKIGCDLSSSVYRTGKTVDKYPIEKFINKAYLIDVTKTDQKIKLADIEDKLPYNSNARALVFYTGYCDKIKGKNSRHSLNEKQKLEESFPYFSIESAEHITKSFPGLNIIGIDSFALDPRGSNSEAHIIFFKNDTLPLETLVNLGALKKQLSEFKKKIFILHSVPINYQNLDAAQVRAFAEF